MWNWIKNLFKKKEVKLEIDDVPLYFKIAKQELGEKEIRGGKHNPRIIEYHSATSLQASTDEIPWCASFCNWVLKQSGIKGTNSARARSFLTWGKKTDKPRKGDIVVFWRGSPDSASGHVAFYVERVNSEYISVLGGNQSDSVCVSHYKSDRVLSYRTIR